MYHATSILSDHVYYPHKFMGHFTFTLLIRLWILTFTILLMLRSFLVTWLSAETAWSGGPTQTRTENYRLQGDYFTVEL